MENEFQEFLLTPTKGRPAFRFIGELIAEADSHRKGAHMWTVLKAYRTRAGRYVVESIGQPGPDTDPTWLARDVYVFDTVEQLTAKIGTGRVAEKLYRGMGITEITIE